MTKNPDLTPTNVDYNNVSIAGKNLSIETMMKYATSIIAHGKYTVQCNNCNNHVHKLTNVNNVMICDDCIVANHDS